MKFRVGKLLVRTGQCLFIGIVLTFGIWRLSLESRIKARVNAVAARGEPVSISDLKRSLASRADGQDATLVWLEGFDLFVPAIRVGYGPWHRLALPDRGMHATEALLAGVKGFVHSNQLALATFHQAASMGSSRFNLNFAKGSFTDPPHLPRLRAAAKLLRLQSFVASEVGDADSAVSSILTILAAARTVESEPTSTAMLARFGVTATGFYAMERLLNCVELNDGQLQELLTAFAQAEDNEGLWRALLGERAMLVSQLQDAEKVFSAIQSAEEASDPSNGLVCAAFEILGIFAREVPFALEGFQALLSSSRLPDPDRFIMRSEWDRMEQRAMKRYYLFSKIILYSISRGVVADCAHRARSRIAQAVLGIERFRLAHAGELPSHFDCGMDPFDGQPLRFRPTPRGYVVYSIGPDAEDNGAEPPTKRHPDGSLIEDIAFFVER